MSQSFVAVKAENSFNLTVGSLNLYMGLGWLKNFLPSKEALLGAFAVLVIGSLFTPRKKSLDQFIELSPNLAEDPNNSEFFKVNKDDVPTYRENSP